MTIQSFTKVLKTLLYLYSEFSTNDMDVDEPTKNNKDKNEQGLI